MRHMLVTWVSKEPLRQYSNVFTGTILTETVLTTANCPGCQVNKNFPGKTAGETRPSTVPPYRWHTVITDYVTGLPETENGRDAMAVFDDKLTNMYT